MSIAVSCGGCGQRFAAPPDLAGKQVSCPACNRPIAVPSQSVAAQGGIVVSCQCGGQFHAVPALMGQTVPCPTCRRPITVGKTSAPPRTTRAAEAVSLDEIASSESIWPTSSVAGTSSFGGASWQQAEPTRDRTHDRLVLYVSAIGGGLLTLFVAIVVIWKVVEGYGDKGDLAAKNNAETKVSATNADPPPGDAAADAGGDVAPKESQDDSAWNLHTSKSGGFEVSIRGSVQLTERKSKTSSVEFAMTHETASLPDASVFDVSYLDLPKADKPDGQPVTIDDLVAKLVERSLGELKSEIAVEVSGHEGREVTIDGQGENGRVAIHARVILVGRRAYQVIWAKPDGSAPNGDSETFVRSFQLVN